MDRSVGCEVVIHTGVALALAIALVGCKAQTFAQARVVREHPPPRQMKAITDPNQIKRLVSFFPGLGRRRSHSGAGWEAEVIVTLTSVDGSVVVVKITDNLDTWSRGRGDFSVKGDLAGFLRELFPEPGAE